MAHPQVTRSCQPCTACCDGWLQIRVEGQLAYPGHPCPHSTGSGCRIYETRPVDPCRQFICGWRMDGSPLPEWMKPGNAKVIVLPAQAQWHNRPVDVAVPVGKRIPPRALNWLKQFAETHNRMLLYSEQIEEHGKFTNRQRVLAYGPPEFQQEMAVNFADGNMNLGVLSAGVAAS